MTGGRLTMHPNFQKEIIHHACFLTVFSWIVISTITLCLHVAHNLTMKTAWIIELCLHSPDVCIDMNLMIGVPKEGKLKLLSFPNVKHTATMLLMICHQYWITNTKQACMGSDAICVPYLLLLLPSGFDLITEPEVLIGFGQGPTQCVTGRLYSW